MTNLIFNRAKSIFNITRLFFHMEKSFFNMTNLIFNRTKSFFNMTKSFCHIEKLLHWCLKPLINTDLALILRLRLFDFYVKNQTNKVISVR